jgi:hypothetical protein
LYYKSGNVLTEDVVEEVAVVVERLNSLIKCGASRNTSINMTEVQLLVQDEEYLK